MPAEPTAVPLGLYRIDTEWWTRFAYAHPNTVILPLSPDFSDAHNAARAPLESTLSESGAPVDSTSSSVASAASDTVAIASPEHVHAPLLNSEADDHSGSSRQRDLSWADPAARRLLGYLLRLFGEGATTLLEGSPASRLWVQQTQTAVTQGLGHLIGQPETEAVLNLAISLSQLNHYFNRTWIDGAFLSQLLPSTGPCFACTTANTACSLVPNEDIPVTQPHSSIRPGASKPLPLSPPLVKRRSRAPLSEEGDDKARTHKKQRTASTHQRDDAALRSSAPPSSTVVKEREQAQDDEQGVIVSGVNLLAQRTQSPVALDVHRGSLTLGTLEIEIDKIDSTKLASNSSRIAEQMLMKLKALF
ncbi:hypothetical protein EXIGLDRAFT_761967 [Exidia glandulosa HHB12029]|uniref:Uncharacterized protein n=1 Tax=Exidia glandulosa HHB12029 TaxID=1314781 RepID=A0A165N252_EXIGL|nr:hypothetical protein EXIGLDRAFT_761967 [Exidia glandulosa HHB12029]